MFVRIATFTLGPNTRPIAERAADASSKVFKGNPACVSYTYFGDYDKGEYGLMAVWRTREAADAAVKANEPAMMQLLGPHLKGAPDVRFYEVYEPKG